MKIIYFDDGTEEWWFQGEHVSEDPDFQDLPLHSFILKSCGDGLSTLALENSQNVLLLVSNVILVTSKVAQYVNNQPQIEPVADSAARERFAGEVFGVWKGVSESEAQVYVMRCRQAGTPIKVMSTYDSLFKLESLLDVFDVIAIDEADMLQEYAQLKANGRNKTDKTDAITHLYELAEQNQERVVFFSATTMGDAYLPDFVKEFRQIRLVTPNMMPPVPMLMKRRNPVSALKREIILPILKDGKVKVGDRTFSKCIIAFNSVSNISKIIRECGLKKEQVGVICGEKNKNAVELMENYGKVDLNHIPQFLFITSSGWRGIDIHDTEAMTIVISSTKKAYHMVSVDTQLNQCIRRQRDKANPNYDRFIFIYNVSDFDLTEDKLLEAWKEAHQRYESNIKLLNEKLDSGDEESYKYALKTFDKDKGFCKYVNFIPGKGLVLNENLFQAVLHRILVVRRSYTDGSATPVEGLLQVFPMVIPDPGGGDPSSFTTLIKAFREQKKTQKDVFTEEQKNSENYQIISKYLAVYGKLPPRLDVAKLKLAYAADNMPVQYMIDMVSPFLKKKGKRIASNKISAHMASLFRKYGLSESTDMPTLISALEENGVKLKRIKSSTIYYEVTDIPDISTFPISNQ